MCRAKINHFKSDKGFAIGTILLAVILIAVIVTAVSYASRGSVGNADKEKSFLDAHMVLDQVVQIQNALARYASTGFGTFTVLHSMDELTSNNWLNSGFGQLSNSPGISPWLTATEINEDPVIGPYLRFSNENFIVRMRVSKSLCLAVLRSLYTNFNVGSHDGDNGNSSGNVDNSEFPGCTYSTGGVPHCPGDPVVTVTFNNNNAKFEQSGGIMGPTCIDMTDMDRHPSIGDYLIVGYVKP